MNDHDDFSTASAAPEVPALEATLDALRAAEGEVIGATIIYGLDGLTGDQLADVWAVWQSLDVDVRRRVLLALIESAETNFELDFRDIGHMALGDESPVVRALAIDLLWEDESPGLMDRLLQMAVQDESVEVRASAASALGRFALLGELAELRAEDLTRVQDVLVEIHFDTQEDMDVRRRALEALANSTHEAVDDAIVEAYQSDDTRMRVSAVFAMGRTSDAQWTPQVMAELESDEPELRFEAARAAGELELQDAVPILAQLAFEADVETRDTAIWSLGEIGGKEAVRVLKVLADEAEERDDEDLQAAIEDALASAEVGGDLNLYLLRLDDEE
jgi:HEAT repeat protein